MARARGAGRRGGFTLVELLVVLAIAGLILAVTPPLLGAALPGLELKAAARRTASALRLTREIAIAQGRPAQWSVDDEGGEYRIEPGGRAGNLPAGISVELEVAATLRGEHSGAIRFFPDGTSTGGLVGLRRGGRQFTVGVNWLTGRVLIEDRVVE